MSALAVSLQQFTGTENYYFLPLFPRFKYTDGVKYLAQKAGAYWLIEAIFSHNRREHFQYWKLSLDAAGRGAILTMQEDAERPYLVEQRIEFTDFPERSIELFLIDGVLLLLSEY